MVRHAFKCYIYETKDKRFENIAVHWGDETLDFIHATGKVIGEFVCDKVDEFHEWQLKPYGKFRDFEEEELQEFLRKSCLSYKEVCDYRRNIEYYQPLFVWHISDLKIYDKPKELTDFRVPCRCLCINCTNPLYDTGVCEERGTKKLTRPPQSWMYVDG